MSEVAVLDSDVIPICQGMFQCACIIYHPMWESCFIAGHFTFIYGMGVSRTCMTWYAVCQIMFLWPLARVTVDLSYTENLNYFWFRRSRCLDSLHVRVLIGEKRRLICSKLLIHVHVPLWPWLRDGIRHTFAWQLLSAVPAILFLPCLPEQMFPISTGYQDCNPLLVACDGRFVLSPRPNVYSNTYMYQPVLGWQRVEFAGSFEAFVRCQRHPYISSAYSEGNTNGHNPSHI